MLTTLAELETPKTYIHISMGSSPITRSSEKEESAHNYMRIAGCSPDKRVAYRWSPYTRSDFAPPWKGQILKIAEETWRRI
jgi:hypothetical protein